ncbi:MAG: hypothetical protein AB1497_04540 [Bacillota bacterium]
MVRITDMLYQISKRSVAPVNLTGFRFPGFLAGSFKLLQHRPLVQVLLRDGNA